MKFSAAILIATGAVFASAQTFNIGALPSCALTCLSTALPASGCGLTDYKCLCGNKGFTSGSATCIKSSCNAADQAKAQGMLDDLCTSVGEPITPPAASSSAAPAPTAAPTASSSAAPAPTAAPTASVSSSAPAPTTTAKSPCKPGFKPRRNAPL